MTFLDDNDYGIEVLAVAAAAAAAVAVPAAGVAVAVAFLCSWLHTRRTSYITHNR